MKKLTEIKNYTLNININSYKEFVDYFYNLSDEDKDEIIDNMIIYKKTLGVKNGNLERIYNMYKILLHKLKYDKLNSKEMYIYEHITAFMIISGDFKNNDLFEKYVTNYLSNITRYNFNSRLFIVMQDILNKLNKEFNKDYCLLFVEQEPLACTYWAKDGYKNKICFSAEVYYENYNNKKLDDIDLEKTLAYHAFIILHEYRHLLQFDHMRNSNDELAQICKFEVYNIYKNEKLYKNNHYSYYIEKDANEFAYKNFYRFIKCYFNIKIIDEKTIKRYNYDTWDIHCKDKKMFLRIYKNLKKIFDCLYESKIETKGIKLLKSKLNEKKVTIQTLNR